LTNWNGSTLGYDLNGNLTNDGVSTFMWDARNQSASRGGIAYQYDAYGRRTRNASGNNLLYSGTDITQELSGTTPVANRITGGVDEFFSRADGGGSFTPLVDALGSVLALTDSAGAIQTQYSYDPFGNTVMSGLASTNTFEYTGR